MEGGEEENDFEDDAPIAIAETPTPAAEAKARAKARAKALATAPATAPASAKAKAAAKAAANAMPKASANAAAVPAAAAKAAPTAKCAAKAMPKRPLQASEVEVEQAVETPKKMKHSGRDSSPPGSGKASSSSEQPADTPSDVAAMLRNLSPEQKMSLPPAQKLHMNSDAVVDATHHVCTTSIKR